MSLEPGARLGPYEILEPLGAGGMGVVYKARDTRLDRTVAIKTLDEKHMQRFEREARAIAALNHPHICALYDIGPDYLVMEYVEGLPLKGPLPVAEAVRLALQIADALATAHAKGIVHRDLKPGNVLVTTAGIKLLDFGIAKFEQHPEAGDSTVTQTQAGTVLGTAAYMSPEQASGTPTNTRSDIFSFGAVLYEALSGRRAFHGETPVTTMAAVLHKEPETLEAPAELVRIVTRCLRKAPAERFESAAELRSALANVMIGAAAEQPSIAVLPFANLSADKDNEYFSDGLAEEILNGLTPLPGLRVIARTSAFAFRGREHAIAEIGEKLKVGSVLHGSVRRSGNRIRVNVQLINVGDESQLWSERYDRELRDVFDIQDEIAQAIVEKLKVKLGTKAGQPLVKRYTENLEAHSLYLKGNFHLYRRFTAEDMEKALGYLEQAVALEPGYAPAWVQLSDYHIAQSVHAVAHPREELPKALEAARRAVAADEALAEAQAALAWHEAIFRFDWTRGLDRFETALRLNSASARSHFWHGCAFCAMSRVEESVAAMRRAVELDSLATLFHSYLALQYIWAGQYDQAADHGRQALEIEPDYGMALAVLGEAYSYLGRAEEGIALLEKACQVLPGDFWPTALLGGAYIRAGRRSQAERLLAELEEKRQRQYVSATSVAVLASALGDADRAVKLLDQAVDDRDPNLAHLAPSPYLKSLRSDPRYRDI
jgi:serine/threonine protein kinase/Flp pilus assembly protein TadD